MEARRLNREGLRQFSNFIEALRQKEKREIPIDFLVGDSTSEEIELTIVLTQEKFNTRYDLGCALVKAIGDQDMQSLVGDSGFWSWLALHWFDQLCPKNKEGYRNPSMVYNYVNSQDYRHKYRHAIYTTWQLVSTYGEFSRFLVSKELPVRGELIEQMMARQYYLSCRGVIEGASSLYWDQEKETFKKGCTTKDSKGSVHRLISWLKQIELTYDVYSLSSDQLLELMPAEFERFRPVA